MVLAAGILQFQLILNWFYARGAYLQDAGWYASLMSGGGLALNSPEALKVDPRSFYSIHSCPLLSGIAGVCQLFLVDHVLAFAFYQTVAFSLLAGVAFAFLRKWFWVPGAFWQLLAALSALLFAYSGLGVIVAGYPHIEVMIPAGLLLCCYFLFAGRRGWGGVVLLFTLLIREDAGLHAACLFFLLGLTAYLRPQHSPIQGRTALGLAALCGLTSIALFASQKIIFPHQQGLLGSNYIGSPPYAHLSVELLKSRAGFYLKERLYLILPLAGLILTAGFFRNPRLLLGLLSVTPWVVLHLLAVKDIPASLYTYYAFPIFWAIFWLLAGMVEARPGVISSSLRKKTTLAFFLINVLSLVGAEWPHREVSIFLRETLSLEGLRNRAPVRNLVAWFSSQKQELGELRCDGAFVSVAPRAVLSNAWMMINPVGEELGTVIYNHRYFEAPAAFLLACSIPDVAFFQLQDTPWWLATRHSAPVSQNLELRPIPVLRAGLNLVTGRWRGDEWEAPARSSPCLALATGYGAFPAGDFRIIFEVRAINATTSHPVAQLTLKGPGPEEKVYAQTTGQLTLKRAEVSLDVKLTEEQRRLVTICLNCAEGADMIVSDFRLERGRSPGKVSPKDGT